MTFSDLYIGYAANLVVALVIVRGIYYPLKHDKNYVFTFIAFNTVVYFVMAFLTSAELSIGVGFGLFAIFSVLRYRTGAISTREMTYLFILLALPVMNSTLTREGNWLMLLASNLTVIGVIFVLEKGWGFHYESARTIKYDRIDLVRPENYRLLLEDLRRRTGLPIKRAEVGRIDLLEDTARVKVYYDEPKKAPWGDEEVEESGYLVAEEE
jgi:hypothetical protein